MVNDRNRTYNESYVQSTGRKEPERDFMEETAAEVTEPVRRNDERGREGTDGAGLGWLALALSILALFIWPVLLGAAGIIVGFIARRRGAGTLGAWAIGIGVVAIIIRLFIMPFYY
ncbi:hypothetical protein [Parageobacillus thermoglucosidasius]|mgnify:FL=1|jgi:uncharacterized membrane protein YdbT with pleckstrin-like domain|uniref:DUF4190 domain-containing protein n=2 Tax=Anoxybacillaceae TaxID=3120669 RepID=A0AAN1D7Y3_PARTM|nr:hypothetical protein [Parageobacillus thermoglucosidasius]KYD13764.1 hypothetical protein B4168_0585 [Anoxybacillus flavithermus]REK55628.1 MAG: hypothetical protein C6P36_10650 [Geobacillus sp.]AEH47206.1 hypothetical protein Geoth_1211 [Parageobacillus thermoglucosidasius C56-YS93]ALF11541.1 hypothetical protein AOT13_16805 [Parageobacillus thermoglucosidasius]ANZ31620.1 hypothetical protein BCV53_16850 [Parageobacillus thermoglucosidasius]